jgi:transcriptional regulator with XRE-family HTH domain
MSGYLSRGERLSPRVPCMAVAGMSAAMGERAHMLMWRRRWTLVEVAERAGLSKSALSRKIRGETPFTVDEAVALAGALEVPVAELLDPASDLGGSVSRSYGRRHSLNLADSGPRRALAVAA